MSKAYIKSFEDCSRYCEPGCFDNSKFEHCTSRVCYLKFTCNSVVIRDRVVISGHVQIV